MINTNNIHAAIGGFHLLNLKDETLEWTAGELQKNALKHFIGAHCTGIEATFSLRNFLGLSRKVMVNGAVGATFTYGEGIYPTWIAR